MDGLTQNGIAIVLYFQETVPWLIKPMAFFNNQVSEIFYILLVATIYWCWNTTLGLRMGILLISTQGIKSFTKLVLHQPRPFWVDPVVRAYNAETSFGIPSGHAVDATVVFGGIAAWIGKLWAWVVAILLILYIGISRVVIGVHFPTDVLAGWLLGAIILLVYLKLEKPGAEFLKKQSTYQQIGYVFLGSLGMILINLLAVAVLRKFKMPEIWIVNFDKAFPGQIFDPLSISSTFSSAGVLFGLGLGFILVRKQGGFNPGGRAWHRIARFALGLTGLVIIYIGLDVIFDSIGLGNKDLPGNIFRYARYGMVGLWASWWAPLAFRAVHLAEPA
jgi:membrane-associated phospholipid phosphatase